MHLRSIGTQPTSAIGLGAMPLSSSPPPARARALDTICAALDAGVRLIDTADAYSPDGNAGHNEEVVAAGLRAWAGPVGEVLVATKGGHVRTPGGGWDLDGRPEHLKAACEASLTRLGGEALGLYQLHRPDPDVPFAESVGALRELLDAGKIRFAGVSNADCDQIRGAAEILPLASVQNELSPRFRSSLDELRLCAQRGIAFLPWSPLGGLDEAGDLGSRHAAFGQVAQERGTSPQAVTLAWLLALAPVVVPIPGSSRPETARDSAAAADLVLTPDELARLDAGRAT